MSHWAEYDYVVINRDLDRAFDEVRAILAAERLKRERQTGLTAFVRGPAEENLTAPEPAGSAQVLPGGAKKHLRWPPQSQRQ